MENSTICKFNAFCKKRFISMQFLHICLQHNMFSPTPDIMKPIYLKGCHLKCSWSVPVHSYFNSTLTQFSIYVYVTDTRLDVIWMQEKRQRNCCKKSNKLLLLLSKGFLSQQILSFFKRGCALIEIHFSF